MFSGLLLPPVSEMIKIKKGLLNNLGSCRSAHNNPADVVFWDNWFNSQLFNHSSFLLL